MAVELTCDELSTLEVLVDMERADRLRWCIANGEQEKNDEMYGFMMFCTTNYWMFGKKLN